MDRTSKTACRERAMYWALKADAFALADDNNETALKSDPRTYAKPATWASLAQVWATLALSAPNP